MRADKCKHGFFYSFNFSIGTPPQNISAMLDTGSRDVVLNSADSLLCKQGHCENGAYNASMSSTKAYVADDFHIGYEIGQGNGSWLVDDLRIGDTTMKGFPFGLMTNSTSPQSFWGLGFPEARLGGTGPHEPANDSLRSMVALGAIKSASASIRLKEPASIIFGGLDASAYTGDLVTLPILQDPIMHVYEEIEVSLNWVDVFGGQAGYKNASSDHFSSFPVRALFDTSSFDVKLEAEFVASVWDALNITHNVTMPNKFGAITYGLCPCSLANSSAFINFGFPGFTVNVPMTSLVLEPPLNLLADMGTPFLLPGTCVFGINPNPNEAAFPMILGPPLLENIYLVIDQENHEVAIAMPRDNPPPPRIREIAPGEADLASVLREALSTGTPTATASTASTASATASAKGTPSPSSGAAGGRDKVPEMLALAMGTFYALVASC